MADHDRLISTLEEYGAGPQIYELFATLWSHQEVVRIHTRYHSPNFIAAYGMTQGGLISTTLFNVVLNNVVWTFIAKTAEDQAMAQERLVLNVGRCLGFLFSGNGMLGSWESTRSTLSLASSGKTGLLQTLQSLGR